MKHYLNLEKGGKSGLTPQKKRDKNGKLTTVYVKLGGKVMTKKPSKAEEAKRERKIDSKLKHVVGGNMFASDPSVDMVKEAMKGKTATKVRQDKDGSVVVTYHKTDVIKFNGEVVTLNSGGYKTKTTKERMNAVLAMLGTKSVGIYQKDKKWYVTTAGGNLEFKDGMRINLTSGGKHKGKVESNTKAPKKGSKGYVQQLFHDIMGWEGKLVSFKMKPDPAVGDVYAVRAVVKEKGKNVTIDGILYAKEKDFEEGEFKSWPPRSSAY